MNIIEIIAALQNVSSGLGELKDILLAVLAGNGGDVLSTEGSLAGSSGAGEIAGSALSAVLSSLGLEELINEIPTSPSEIISSVS